ncbi:MAG TPA: CHAT domain-containing protein, partial [Pyrinomonadaceae bacterium]|nr:CHAT domain-containing protein [Pyrinomonadaceae bacterium]
MRFSIATTPTVDGWKVEISCKEKPDFKVPARELKRCGKKPDGFPLPDPADKAAWNQKIHAPLCELLPTDDPAPIKTVFEDIIFKSDPGPQGVETFGRYLSAVLLGTNWEAMEKEADKEPIELDLEFAPSDVEMNRLPWEMMYGADKPLAADPARDISINRIVDGKPATTRIISLPLKLLFVIGRQLDDALRPGAEYLGMLRRMNVRFGADARNMDLNVRLLTETTIDELQAAVNEFKPDVVHFICHGDIGDSGGRLLLTKRETEEVTSKKTQDPDYCDADRLLALLRQDESPHELPQIIVLNACHTAEASGENIKGGYRALAANLVAGGVPIAIGMTGEVADGACRIFTRKFYEALLTQNLVTLASARGRRAALTQLTYDYKTSVEWARPTLFIAKGVSSSIKLDISSTARQISHIPSKYIENPAALCDRFAPLQTYQKFRNEAVKDSSPKLLAFKVDEPEVGADRFGKTRFLEELAAHAVMDGFIPCTLLSRPSDSFEPSPNLLTLAIRVAEKMDIARDHFDIPKRYTSEALKSASRVLKGPAPVSPDPKNRAEFEWQKGEVIKDIARLGQTNQPDAPPPAFVRAAMLADFRVLQSDVETKTGEKRIPLLVLDDLHRYEGVASELLNELVDGYGLGEKDLIIPLVFTYSSV